MSAAESLLTTPLHALHLELGARMVPFAGYSMPVQYPAGLLAEHHHTRRAAGLFDVSHMGQLRLSGPKAAAAFETLVPMDVLDLPPGRQRYGLLLTDEGGILDDLMFVNLGRADIDGSPPSRAETGACAPPEPRPHTAAEHGGAGLLVVVNGACKMADIAYIQAHIGAHCVVEPLPERALLALQGPQAATALARLLPGVDRLVFMSGARFDWQDCTLFVTRSGYTGEDGFELSVPAARAEALARALLAQPEIRPVGLGARNSLRLEAGLCLYGHDIDATTTPVEAALTWAIPKVRRVGGARAGGFPGAGRVLAQLQEPALAARRRVGLAALERIPVREPAELRDVTGQRVGEVTSGLLSPSTDQPIALGYVQSALAVAGTRMNALVRGKSVPMQVRATPFVPARYYRG